MRLMRHRSTPATRYLHHRYSERTSVRVMLATLALAACGLVHAGPSDELRAFLSNSQTAKGDFAQRIERASSRPVVSSGQFSMQRPSKFRWEITKPSLQWLLGDGEKIYFYDEDLKQVTARKAGDVMASTPAGLLFGVGGAAALDANFSLTDAAGADGKQWVNARPKSKDAAFEVIRITMQKGLPDSIEVSDALGQKTLITFKNLQVGGKLDAALFRFSLPTGAELVQQ
jgi:outer membrane lipoprotein carrier protein